MAIARSTIATNIFDTLRTILNADDTVKVDGTLGVNEIISSYSEIFIKNAGGLPFIVIHKPNITEEKSTFIRKFYNVVVDIECIANSQAVVKTLADGVRNALESANTSTTGTRANGLTDFIITADIEDFDRRNNKRIHFDRLTCEYTWIGDVRTS